MSEAGVAAGERGPQRPWGLNPAPGKEPDGRPAYPFAAGRGARRYWRALNHRAARWVRYLERQRVRVSAASILETLRRFQSPGPELLLVHSSLSSCGHIAGGPAALLRALVEWTCGGTLVMPAHSYCYPEGDQAAPVFYADSTASELGAISNYFRQLKGVVRSLHPSHSLACAGPRRAEICHGHELCDTPCGPGTPYERLIEEDASVLMFGVPMSCYTLFYTSEHMAGVPHLYYPERCRLRFGQPTGEVRELLMWRQSNRPRRFAEVGQLMEEEGLILRQPLGRGVLRLVPSARRAHLWLLERLRDDPEFLLARAIDGPMPSASERFSEGERGDLAP